MTKAILMEHGVDFEEFDEEEPIRFRNVPQMASPKDEEAIRRSYVTSS